MAKPVTGALSYNPTLDRPTVFLQSGEKRLLTEDDSSGGSLTSVASTSDAIVVTDPTGPAVSLDLDKTALENGGSEELDLGGMPVDTLVESSGPTDLAIGSVSDGQYLVRSGSTVIGTTVTAPSEWWALPATAHAEDVEGNSSTLPSGFTLFNVSGATPSTVSPISGIDIFTQPAAGNVRIEANKANKRSWILMQPRGENVRWQYSKKITLSGTNGWVFRTRIATHTLIGGGNNNASTMRLVLAKDDGGGTKPNVISGTTQDGCTFGWEPDANNVNVKLSTLKAGAATTPWTSTDKDDPNTPVDWEFVALLLSGSATNDWQFYMRSSGYCWLVYSANSAAIGIKQGDDIWIGWEFAGIDATAPSAPILSADYLRFENTAANFLP